VECWREINGSGSGSGNGEGEGEGEGEAYLSKAAPLRVQESSRTSRHWQINYSHLHWHWHLHAKAKAKANQGPTFAVKRVGNATLSKSKNNLENGWIIFSHTCLRH